MKALVLAAALAAEPTEPSRYYGFPIIAADAVFVVASYTAFMVGWEHRSASIAIWVPAQVLYLSFSPVVHELNGRSDLAALSFSIRLGATVLPWLIVYSIRESVAKCNQFRLFNHDDCPATGVAEMAALWLQGAYAWVDPFLARTRPGPTSPVSTRPWFSLRGGGLTAGVSGAF